MKAFGILLALTTLYSCGKSNSSAGIPWESKILPINGSNIEGLYLARFSSVSGSMSGTAAIERINDKFTAFVRVHDGESGVWHQQNIHVGSRCPNASDDTNGDGVIDIDEGNAVWGKILIPLDSNLSSQSAGSNNFPISNAFGKYSYKRSTSFEAFFSDLKSEDENPDDEIIKLAPQSGLDFSGKVVVVLGSSSTPVACGVLSQVTSIPDDVTEYDDTYNPTPPAPIPDPVPEPDPEPIPEEENDDDDWYTPITDWWRRVWDGRHT